MTRIEEIEKLKKHWKAEKILMESNKSHQFYHYCKGAVDLLGSALTILNRPPNQEVAGRCSCSDDTPMIKISEVWKCEGCGKIANEHD